MRRFRGRASIYKADRIDRANRVDKTRKTTRCEQY